MDGLPELCGLHAGVFGDRGCRHVPADRVRALRRADRFHGCVH